MPTICQAVRTLASVPLLALLACNAADPVQPSLARVAPSFDVVSGPLTPGPIIVRTPGFQSRVITEDIEDGLVAIHGQVSNLAECTNASTRVPTDVQVVRTPSDAQNLIFLLHGSDNEFAVYNAKLSDVAAPFQLAKFCAFIANTIPAYTGTADYRLHIDGQGNNLFQWVGTATRTTDGAQFRFSDKQFAVVQNGVLSFLIEDIAFHGPGR
ncbi:MAG TPA: hypothetical protein VM076_16070 [Gemmatimonadaceae bacterium]|nr:hypothetical protein [Gemmatimonadaceae bacterium]